MNKFLILLALLSASSPALSASSPLAWPELTRESRPGAYWWWLGSAVDRTNLTRELQRYHDAGMGTVHIIPIYGAKGWEEKYISYLSPQWMDMLRYTISEAQRLDMNVDMTTGTGWCFGGPSVTDLEANASVVVKTLQVASGASLQEKFNPKAIQAIVAFGASQPGSLDLTDKLRPDGTLDWVAKDGAWRVYAVSQRPSGQKVKRAGPGGQGHMLNLFYAPGVSNYMRAFTEAFANYPGPWPRAMYHDSYEYRSDWSPDFFAQFAKRRGYRLQTELPALFGKEENEHAARVKCDYRETISDIMAEESLPAWVKWCHDHQMLTRNEAHGSPGNLLDLYAVADIPETEMFHTDRNKLVSKMASSAAHVAGRRLVASETGTWLQEHFTETLADMKYLLDDLFLSGVNHILYHGACYSPDEAPWPGWLFYASFEMNPRNSIWRGVPALNAYAARCQSILQHGQPDADVLLYWPIYDRWHSAKGRVQAFSVHARDWLEGQPVGQAAEFLWQRGYAFDYISDRQLLGAEAKSGAIVVPGGKYRAVVVPACEHIPVATMRKLLDLASKGIPVIFENQMPSDVPGWNDLEKRRAELKGLVSSAYASDTLKGARRTVLVGKLETALQEAGVVRESLTDQAGLMFIRRSFDGGRHYFIANRGEKAVLGWVPLATAAKSIVVMDLMTGRTGLGAMREGKNGKTEVLLRLEAGESIILRTLENPQTTGPAWTWSQPASSPIEITGAWQVRFLQGGPQLPPPFQTQKLASWTELGGEEAQRFAGTASYTISFDAPSLPARQWYLDLGKVSQSARVRLNGRELGTVFISPFRVLVDQLKPKDNLLEIEVTNVSANRIRDLDKRKVAWKNFHDINFVSISYKPFDASNWPFTDSGLLGPVTLTAAGEAAK